MRRVGNWPTVSCFAKVVPSPYRQAFSRVAPARPRATTTALGGRLAALKRGEPWTAVQHCASLQPHPPRPSPIPSNPRLNIRELCMHCRLLLQLDVTCIPRKLEGHRYRIIRTLKVHQPLGFLQELRQIAMVSFQVGFECFCASFPISLALRLCTLRSPPPRLSA